jgi:excisionase family DNA binding protein
MRDNCHVTTDDMSLGPEVTRDMTRGARKGPLSHGHGPSHRRLLDLHEAGNYLGVSYWTVRDLTQAGVIPIVRMPNARRKGESVRRVLIDVQDLDVLIASWKERA